MKKVIVLLLTSITLTISAQEKTKNAVKPKNQPTNSSKPKTMGTTPGSQQTSSPKPKTIKTASGLEYTITQKGTGKKPKNGDNVIVHYTGKLTNDSVFDSSIKRGQPFTFKLGAGQVIKGWDEAFLLLQVGDRATIKFGPELGYGSNANGAIPANSTLIFDIELLDVKEGIRAWDAKGKDTLKTPSGLKYIILKENKAGDKVALGTIAEFHFSGFFNDGKLFDSSVERGKALQVKMGQNQLFSGWEEGLSLLRNGEKAKLIIPAALAFGEKGYPPTIPANADLIMDIEILSVKKIVVPPLFDIKGIEAKTTASGLKYYEVKKSGSLIKAEAGKKVKVHYSGYFADGKMFDSSVERGEPIEFLLGQGQVILGWDEGIALMSVGDKLRLVIPYALAYGETGRPPSIPAKADLTFDVELVSVGGGN